MIPFAPPEILTSDLSSLVLDLAVWGVTDPSALAWLDPPPQGAWESARRLLMDLDALNQNGTATPMGRAMARFPLHPRLGRLLLRAADSGHLRLGADLAALLSERDIMRRNRYRGDIPRRGVSPPRLRCVPLPGLPAGGGGYQRTPLNASALAKEKGGSPGTDPWALQSVERVAEQLRELAAPGQSSNASSDQGRSCRSRIGRNIPADYSKGDVISSLLLHAYPDRIAQRRAEGGGRYLLAQGRGVRLPQGSVLGANPFLVAVHLDSGEKAEGTIHMAEPVAEETIRQEMGTHIETIRQVEWNRQEGRILSFLTERLGALTLSAIPFSAPDEEVIPILCQAIRSGAAVLTFGRGSQAIAGQGRPPAADLSRGELA